MLAGICLRCFSGGDAVATDGGDMVNSRLSKRTVDALQPRAKPYVEFDTDVKGFGCRVMPSGVKSYVLEYRPGGGGRAVAKKRLTLGKHGAMTAEQARKAALDALARVRLGEDPQQEKATRRAAPTVAELIRAFLEGHGSKLKPKTRVHYEGLLAKLDAAYGNSKASALKRAHIAALHHGMASTPYFANRLLAVASKCVAWGLSRGLLPEGHINPATRIGRYREARRERFLTSEELSRLGDTLRLAETEGLPWQGEYTSKHTPKEANRRTVLDPHAIAAIRLLILTGARLREVLHAKWQEVDFERGILFLSDSKTGRKPIYLSAAALAVLASLPRLAGNPYIIAGERPGAPRADLKKPWAAVTKAAGLEGVRLHDLRHSFASIGAGASLGLPIIGKLLGHSQAATTHRYAHLDADPMRRAAETIGATIAAALGGGSAENSTVIPMSRSQTGAGG
jgi:integrase